MDGLVYVAESGKKEGCGCKILGIFETESHAEAVALRALDPNMNTDNIQMDHRSIKYKEWSNDTHWASITEYWIES